MSGENRVKLSERIYERAKVLWPRYLTHPFVTEMAGGTLPREKFRYYMVQDYLYLRDYVKIFAAILQKTDDFEQIRFLSGEMANTIDETFRTHLPYMKRLGVTEEEIAEARPHIDNSAYSHYMLCEAQAGDVLTGLVTLLGAMRILPSRWWSATQAPCTMRTTARGSRATFPRSTSRRIGH